MSVLKNLQNLSKMEFYKNAIRIRHEVTNWLLKDFGYNRNPKSIRHTIKGIEADDQEIIDAIFSKYGRSLNKEFETVYPDWFVEFEREAIVKILNELVYHITFANSIYAVKDFEFDLRRKDQDAAISCCYCLYQELQYIRQTFCIDLNKWQSIFDMIDKEVDLLKDWRQSDNKRRPKKKVLRLRRKKKTGQSL